MFIITKLVYMSKDYLQTRPNSIKACQKRNKPIVNIKKEFIFYYLSNLWTKLDIFWWKKIFKFGVSGFNFLKEGPTKFG